MPQSTDVGLEYKPAMITCRRMGIAPGARPTPSDTFAVIKTSNACWLVLDASCSRTGISVLFVTILIAQFGAAAAATASAA